MDQKEQKEDSKDKWEIDDRKVPEIRIGWNEREQVERFRAVKRERTLE